MRARRAWLQRALGAASGVLLAEGFGSGSGLGRAQAQDAPPRVIAVEAKRFRFTPEEIRVRKGEAVTLAFTAVDFAHGFFAPDFNLRADLVPGTVTKVALQAKDAGRFTFLCDNFCGEGHESMGGALIVE